MEFNKFLEEIIKEFKNIKRVRGDLFSNFLSFVNLYLTGLKDDKYKDIKKNILQYIVLNRETITMKLIQN